MSLRVLLVERDSRRTKPKGEQSPQKGKPSDETLWYPPLGLMKLARFHKDRHDNVTFAYGCDPCVTPAGQLFADLWDRVYITTLFTFHFDKIVDTIKFYIEAVGGTVGKILVGGIMASLMAEELYRATNVRPFRGVLHSPRDIGLDAADVDIDLLPPDYAVLPPGRYGIRDTFHAYTSRGCVNRCAWCGVPRIEPKFVPYIDIKPMIQCLRTEYGDKSRLCLMDNNVLASPRLGHIVEDLLSLGYGRGQYTQTHPKKQRVIDFNQGLDASFVNEHTMNLLAKLNIRPMRIAFDRVMEREQYERAVGLARSHGVQEFSNYMLYNFKDTPRDLYDRLAANIELNERWVRDEPGRASGKIYSYPMRYAPIHDHTGNGDNRQREQGTVEAGRQRRWLTDPIWTPRFARSVEIMKGAAYGAISPTPTLAWRTVGISFDEFVANLYMPEELLRNRNRHEKTVHAGEPRRRAGSGKVEEFREFMLGLLRTQDDRFWLFHDAVIQNSVRAIRECLDATSDHELRTWLRFYLRKE